jgi:hypothetical protein
MLTENAGFSPAFIYERARLRALSSKKYFYYLTLKILTLTLKSCFLTSKQKEQGHEHDGTDGVFGGGRRALGGRGLGGLGAEQRDVQQVE